MKMSEIIVGNISYSTICKDASALHIFKQTQMNDMRALTLDFRLSRTVITGESPWPQEQKQRPVHHVASQMDLQGWVLGSNLCAMWLLVA